jgi:iron-sulfur cluster assembly accessory protein
MRTKVLFGGICGSGGTAEDIMTAMETQQQQTQQQEMIQLSATAAGKVKELLEQEGQPDVVLRVAVQPGGCSGLRYSMYLDDQVGDSDVAAEQHGVRVVVDRMSAPYLKEAKIDFVDSLEASGFTIDNPVAQGTCACGHSFH